MADIDEVERILISELLDASCARPGAAVCPKMDSVAPCALDGVIGEAASELTSAATSSVSWPTSNPRTIASREIGGKPDPLRDTICRQFERDYVPNGD